MSAQCDLEELRSSHAHVRLPGDLTGPSIGHVIVVRHTRFRGHSQADWRDGDLQHHGRQTADELSYIMEPRPEKGLYVFTHDQLPMDASRRPRRASRGNWCEILGKQAREADP